MLFMAVGRTWPRHQGFILLFPKSSTLRNSACLYFATFVQMCREIVLFLRKPFLSQVSDTLTRAFGTEFDSYQNRLLTLASSVREEVSLASKHLQVSEAELQALERKEMWSFRQSVRQELTEAKRWRRACLVNELLDTCSTFDHRVAWKRARKRGVSRWFLGADEYKAWRLSERSSLLCCTGILGSGKTVMTASLIEDLMLASKIHVTYFICTHDNPNSLKARTITGSLARQILEPIHCQLDMQGLTRPPSLSSVGDVWDLLKRFLPALHWQEIIMVIDGLDECDKSEIEAVLSSIQLFRQSLPSKCPTFKFYLSSRPELLRSLSTESRPDFAISMADGGADMIEYVESTLEELCLDGTLRLGNPRIITDIRDALDQGAQGMFLWIHFQILEICSRRTDRSILEALDNLPKNFPETFDRILQRVGDTGHENASLCKRMFKIIIAAMVPLTLEELQEVLSVEPGHIVWDPTTFINDIQFLVNSSGGLLIKDEEARTVHFVHHSFRHYLLQSAPAESYPISYRINQTEATMLLGQICLTYLNFDVFHQQVVKSTAKKTSDLNPASIVENSIQKPGLASKLAIAYLKGRRNPDLDAMQTLLRSTGVKRDGTQFSTSLGAFREYAKKYWHFHYNSNPNSERYSKFRYGKGGASLALRHIYLGDVWDIDFDSAVRSLRMHPHLPFLAVASHRSDVIEKLELHRRLQFSDSMSSNLLAAYNALPQDPGAPDSKFTGLRLEQTTSWTLWMLSAALGDSKVMRLIFSLEILKHKYGNTGDLEWICLRAFETAASRKNHAAMEFIAKELVPKMSVDYRYIDNHENDILYYAVIVGDSSATLIAKSSLPLDLSALDPFDLEQQGVFIDQRLLMTILRCRKKLVSSSSANWSDFFRGGINGSLVAVSNRHVLDTRPYRPRIRRREVWTAACRSHDSEKGDPGSS